MLEGTRVAVSGGQLPPEIRARYRGLVWPVVSAREAYFALIRKLL